MFDILDSLEITVHEHDRLLIQQARCLIVEEWPVYDSDETGLYLKFDGLYMDIEFGLDTPVIIFSANRAVDHQITNKDRRSINKLNLRDPLGQHSLDEDLEHYLYRRSLWLQEELAPEVLEYFIYHCLNEAARGYDMLAANHRRHVHPHSGFTADRLRRHSED